MNEKKMQTAQRLLDMVSKMPREEQRLLLVYSEALRDSRELRQQKEAG